MKRRILLTASAMMMTTSAATAADTAVVLDQSRPFVAKSNASQRYADYIDLKGGQERLPLTLTFNNGDNGSGFTWIRVSIAGRPYFTEKDFKGGKTLAVDLTGDLGSGSSQIVALCGGQTGASLSWTLTTPQPELVAADPIKVANGKNVTLTGQYFSKYSNDNAVLLDTARAQVVSSNPKQIQFKVPDDAKSGKVKVSVSVCGIKALASKPVELTVLVKPEVTGLDMFSAAPGQTVTISGKNFSTTASENKVFIGGEQASIASASDSSITCEVPAALDAQNPSWGLPVVVEVNGVKSNDNVTFNVQMRNIPYETSPIGPRD